MIWVEKEYKVMNFEGKNFKFWIRPIKGQWEGPDIIGGTKHANFGIEFYDINNKLVARHNWVCWWHVATLGMWGSLGDPLEFSFNVNPASPYRGGLTKGEGDPRNIKKIRYYMQTQSEGEFAFIWDDLHEVSLDEYILPSIEKFLTTWKEYKLGNNWNLPLYKVSDLKPSIEIKKDMVFIKGGNLKLSLNKELEILEIENFIRKEKQKTKIEPIIVFDGNKDFKEVALKTENLYLNKNSLISKKSNEEIKIENKIKPEKDAIFWHIFIENKKDKVQKLEIKFNLPCNLNEEFFYYDGCEFYKNPQDYVERIYEPTIYGALYPYQIPFIALYDENSGIILGRDPYQYFSYEKTSFKYLNKNTGILSYLLRIAIRPKENYKISFVLGSVPSSYRFFSCLDLYQKLFPDAFKPNKDIDPNLYKGESMGPEYFGYRNLREKDNDILSLELFRRFGQGWYWKFGGYKRLGDWYGKKEYFSGYKQEEGWKKTPYWEYLEDYDKFHNWRKNIWAGKVINSGCAVGFYLSNFCEEELANKIYKDEDIKEGLPDCIYNYGPLGRNNGGPRMYWWYTKFGEDTLKDFEKIREEISLSAICMDNIRGNGGFKYRGEKVLSKTEGLSFDEKGLYVDEGIGISQLFNAIRNLPKDKRGYRLAVASDASNTWPTCMNTDVFLLEGGSFGGNVDNPIYAQFINRIRLGTKPISLHCTHWGDRQVPYRIDIEKFSSEFLRDIYRKMFGFTKIGALCFGTAFSVDDVMGVPEMIKVSDIPEKENLSGYRPISGLRCEDEMVICSRFGDGIGSILSIGNTYPEKKRFKFKIENNIFGDGVFLICEYFGLPVELNFNKDFSEFSYELKRWDADIFLVIMKIKDLKENKGKGSFKMEEKDYGKQISGYLNFEKLPENIICEFLIPDNHKVENVVINEKPTKFEIVDKKTGRFLLPKTKNLNIKIEFQSEIFLSSKAEIINFKYIDENLNGLPIVIPDNYDFIDERAGKRIYAFFRVWYSEALDKRYEINMPIIRKKEFKTDKGILIGDFGKTGIYIKENSLIISGKSPEEREKFILELLKLLENKYIFHGYLPYGRLKEAGLIKTIEMRKKANLYEKATLDFN